MRDGTKISSGTVSWDEQQEHLIFDYADPSLIQKFKKYHRENPEVYFRFTYFSMEMKKAGFKRYSPWGIVHRVRWHFDKRSSGSSAFKVNNDFVALFSRLLMHDHPVVFGRFFNKREMKTYRRQISREERRRIAGSELVDADAD